jgi:hypothetical protein
MKKCLAVLVLSLGVAVVAVAQNVSLLDNPGTIKSRIGETLRIPIRARNNSDRPLQLIIRRTQDLTGTQKAYFCVGDDCLDPSVEEIGRKLEPGASLENVYYALETGLVGGTTHVSITILNRQNLVETTSAEFAVSISDHTEKSALFQSRDITLFDVYPNPVSDFANIDYSVHNEAVDAQIILHNILGNLVGTYTLPGLDTKAKISALELPAGVYFYTLVVNDEGVMTRKLIIRK